MEGATGVGMVMIDRRTYAPLRQGVRSRPSGAGPAARFQRKLRTVEILTILLLQLQAGAAWAETVTLTPPYAESSTSTYRGCPSSSVCVAEATADHTTGELGFNVAAVGLGGIASASGEIVGTHALEAESNRIQYTVNVHIAELVAENATANLKAYASHSTCSECDDSTVIGWSGLSSPSVVAGEDVSLPLILRNRAGGPIPQGAIRVVVGFGGFASYSCNFLVCPVRAAASGRATVTSMAATWNNNPVAADDSASSRAGFPVRINVLANDSDRDGDPLTVTEVSDPPNGSAVINADNTVTYDPDGCFVGTDTFTYTISDGKDGTDTASVAVLLRKASRRSSIGC